MRHTLCDVVQLAHRRAVLLAHHHTVHTAMLCSRQFCDAMHLALCHAVPQALHTQCNKHSVTLCRDRGAWPSLSVFRGVLRFVQLLCEGHHLQMQNYLREQPGSTSPCNVVIEVMGFLKEPLRCICSGVRSAVLSLLNVTAR